jgi:hypothetical protein
MEKGSQSIAVITQNLKDARAQKLKVNSFFDKVEVKRDGKEDEVNFKSEVAKSLTKRKNLRHVLQEARRT